jgi:glycine cleavage system protein P-like pyridoxal-binding family
MMNEEAKNIPVTPEQDRITALERKMKEMEALMKGLTEELLDLKSIAMKLNKVSEERRVELKMSKPVAQATASGGTVIMPIAEPVEKMDQIMQLDGTLKPEKRANGDYIVASASYSKKKPGFSESGDPKKKNTLIVAEDDEKAAKK